MLSVPVAAVLHSAPALPYTTTRPAAGKTQLNQPRKNTGFVSGAVCPSTGRRAGQEAVPAAAEGN